MSIFETVLLFKRSARWRTWSSSPFRSTLLHRRPRSSDARKPVNAAVSNSAGSLALPFTASINRLISAEVAGCRGRSQACARRVSWCRASRWRPRDRPQQLRAATWPACASRHITNGYKGGGYVGSQTGMDDSKRRDERSLDRRLHRRHRQASRRRRLSSFAETSGCDAWLTSIWKRGDLYLRRGAARQVGARW